MKYSIYDSRHWKERAEMTRAKARFSFNKDSEKWRLNKIAEEYDRIADKVAEQTIKPAE